MKPIALVTGASGGIGAAVAKRFIDRSYAVVLQYHTHPEAVQTIAASFPNGASYLCTPCNLTDDSSVEDLRQTIHLRLGHVSVLINCAGVALPQMLLTDTTEADYARVFEANVHGTVRMCKAFYDDLRENHGAIVNISSIWGVAGGSCESLYSATKAAVIGLTRSLAAELGPSGVRVNCVAPGWIDTAMTQHLPEEAKQAYIDDTPLGRIGTPKDVADAVFYLANASYVTGQTLRVDGGYTL